MASALICIGSPLQALCAVEALQYFEITQYEIKVIDDGARLSQIENYLKGKRLEYSVVPFHVSSMESVRRIFNVLNFYSGKYDYLLMGDYRLIGYRLCYLPYIKNGGKIVFLDDGSYIVSLANGNLPETTTTKLRNKISETICRLRCISCKNLYTIYAKDISMAGYNIIENRFFTIKAKNDIIGNDTYVIGTNPLGKGGYCTYLGVDYESYKSKLYDFLVETKRKSGKGDVYYIPHGRDLSQETMDICERADVKYQKCHVCVEMFVTTLDSLPKRIIGFGSSALYTLHYISPKSEIINVLIPGTIKSSMQEYENIGIMYAKVGILNKII